MIFGCEVVSLLAIYSDDPSSNPDEVCTMFIVESVLRRLMKILLEPSKLKNWWISNFKNCAFREVNV